MYHSIFLKRTYILSTIVTFSASKLYTHDIVAILIIVMRGLWIQILILVIGLGGAAMTGTAAATYEKATLAGGCFWCMEPPFENLDGVVSVTSGYAGGKEKQPTYEQVSSGKTGHVEAIQIVFDPNRISFNCILDVFWRQINPTDDSGQFADRGSQYRAVIFYHDEKQREIAKESKRGLESSGWFDKPIVTPILPFVGFYAAEDYHQDYFRKSPSNYKRYRLGSGRESFLQNQWGDKRAVCLNPWVLKKPSDKELRNRLTDLQYRVTQLGGTEPPFENQYWENKSEGIYVDVVSGEPLFASVDKYDSGSGWPSFTKPLEPDNIVEKQDISFGMTRIEVRSKKADSHLGHVFKDGPAPGGLRYCINSAALRFVSKSELLKKGYGKYLALFE